MRFRNRIRAALSALFGQTATTRTCGCARPSALASARPVLVPLTERDRARVVDLAIDAVSHSRDRNQLPAGQAVVTYQETPAGLRLRVRSQYASEMDASFPGSARRTVLANLRHCGYVAETVPGDPQLVMVTGRDPAVIATMSRAEAEALQDAVLSRLVALDMDPAGELAALPEAPEAPEAPGGQQ